MVGDVEIRMSRFARNEKDTIAVVKVVFDADRHALVGIVVRDTSRHAMVRIGSLDVDGHRACVLVKNNVTRISRGLTGCKMWIMGR